MKTAILFVIGATFVCTPVAMAGDQGFVKEGSSRSIKLPSPAISLKDGTGMDVTRRYCSICHSLDYITTQQKFPKPKWQAEVAKMIKTYGAPIPEESATIIVDYISTHYGTGG